MININIFSMYFFAFLASIAIIKIISLLNIQKPMAMVYQVQSRPIGNMTVKEQHGMVMNQVSLIHIMQEVHHSKIQLQGIIGLK